MIWDALFNAYLCRKYVDSMQIHFIAIGGSAMHNLALALHDKGYKITGSDDVIYEPSKTRLAKQGLLPEAFGWYPEKLSKDIDAVILGMHAKSDNPELAPSSGTRITNIFISRISL